MKSSSASSIVLGIAFTVVFVGCVQRSPGRGHVAEETIAEGVIYFVEYKLGDGKTGGFTRRNDSDAVPGGNGSWNVDARGRLTTDYLIITRPQKPQLGPRVIPAHRLIEIQFGDGGIKNLEEGNFK